MRGVRSAFFTTVALIMLLIALAHELRPYLPWIFGLIIFGYIVWLLLKR
jgi:hypothetical protein